MERLVRELARLIMQRTIRRIESTDRDQTVSSFRFGGESYRRNRRTANNIDIRFGAISYDRWYFQNTQPKMPGIAPLDMRLGIVAERMTPALAEAIGQLIDWIEEARRSDGKHDVLLQVGRDGVFVQTR